MVEVGQIPFSQPAAGGDRGGDGPGLGECLGETFRVPLQEAPIQGVLFAQEIQQAVE